jgi:shikimate kinase
MTGSNKTLRPIFLIGFMGTGKSTVGTLLAGKLERRFVDLDAVIEAEAHMTIRELFFQEQEAGFRAREAEALRRVITQGPQVISCGGGAPTWGDNLEVMLSAGTVVCLTASIDELVRRIGDPRSRPLLAGVGAAGAERSGTDAVSSEVERLLALRQQFYARAHLMVDTTGLAPSQVARRIAQELTAP